MRNDTKTPAGSDISGGDHADDGRKRQTKRSRSSDPVRTELRRRRFQKLKKLEPFFQIVKTLIAVLIWVTVMPLYVGIISPYVSYNYAFGATTFLVIPAAMLLHLWPPRTPPWRTLFWAFLIMAMTGALLLTLGLGTMALTVTTIVGYGFVALRINQFGRKLVGLWKAGRVGR